MSAYLPDEGFEAAVNRQRAEEGLAPVDYDGDGPEYPGYGTGPDDPEQQSGPGPSIDGSAVVGSGSGSGPSVTSTSTSGTSSPPTMEVQDYRDQLMQGLLVVLAVVAGAVALGGGD